MVVYKNFCDNQKAGKNICQVVQWKKPNPGHALSEWWNIDRKLLPLHYLNTEEKEDKKTTQAIASSFLRHTQTQ